MRLEVEKFNSTRAWRGVWLAFLHGDRKQANDVQSVVNTGLCIR